MKFKTNQGKFVLVPEGKQDLRIDSVKCVPKAKPEKIEVSFSHQNGGKLTQNYKLGVDAAVYYFTMLYNHATGDTPIELDTDKIPAAIEDKFIKGLVEHTEGTRMNEDGEYPTFANLKKSIKPSDGWGTLKPEADDDLDEDDLDDLDDLDEDDDEDLPD